MEKENLAPDVEACIAEMIAAGEFSEGEGCDGCGYCVEFDVRGPEGFGKIGTAKYCKLGLWQDDI